MVGAAKRRNDLAFQWFCELDTHDEPGAVFARLADTGRFGPSDAKLLAEIKRITKGTSIGDDVLMKERELCSLVPPAMLRGRQAFAMVMSSFATDAELGAVYGIEDIQHVKCRNASLVRSLKDFSLAFRRVRMGLSAPWNNDSPETRATLEFYFWKQIETSTLLRDELLIYKKAKRGSDERSLSYLMGIVDDAIKLAQLETNRKDQLSGGVKSGAPATKAKAKAKQKPDARVRSASPAVGGAGDGTWTDAIAQGLCIAFIKGSCARGDACKYKHEEATTKPTSAGGRRQGEGQEQGQGRHSEAVSCCCGQDWKTWPG